MKKQMKVWESSDAPSTQAITREMQELLNILRRDGTEMTRVVEDDSQSNDTLKQKDDRSDIQAELRTKSIEKCN